MQYIKIKAENNKIPFEHYDFPLITINYQDNIKNY
jgi:hypothetical protein